MNSFQEKNLHKKQFQRNACVPIYEGCLYKENAILEMIKIWPKNEWTMSTYQRM